MSDEEQRVPKFFTRATAFIGGLTGLIVAVVGLRAAYVSLAGTDSTGAAELAAEDENAAESANDESQPQADGSEQANAAEGDAAGAASAPLHYSRPSGSLQFVNEQWVEVDDTTGDRFTFREVSRSDGMTVIFDASRDMYLRWPNGGGTVQWSNSDPEQWTDLYVATPVS